MPLNIFLFERIDHFLASTYDACAHLFVVVSDYLSAATREFYVENGYLSNFLRAVKYPNLYVSSGCMITLALLAIVCCRWNRRKRKSKISNGKCSCDIFEIAKAAYVPGNTERLINSVNRTAFDVNYQLSQTGLTLFLCACLSGERRAVNFLLRKGADVSITTHTGDSALYLATYGLLCHPNPNIRLLQDLINTGCSVNVQNDRGYTPLHRAANKGDIDVVKFLLHKGANPCVATNSGYCPADSALTAGHAKIVKLLEEPCCTFCSHSPTNVQLALQTANEKEIQQSSALRSVKRQTMCNEQ